MEWIWYIEYKIESFKLFVSFLLILEEPEQPKNLRVVETHSRRVKLSWMAPYNGNAPIQNYLIQYKLASGKHSSFTHACVTCIFSTV